MKRRANTHSTQYNCWDMRSVKPDPERLEPLVNLPLPTNAASLTRALGMFSHYSKWVPNYSDKIRSLVATRIFPVTAKAASDFNRLKDVVKSVISAIDEHLPFVVETDASEYSTAAVLSQSASRVAFFSKTLSQSELKHSSVEKEAYAIVETMKNGAIFLLVVISN